MFSLSTITAHHLATFARKSLLMDYVQTNILISGDRFVYRQPEQDGQRFRFLAFFYLYDICKLKLNGFPCGLVCKPPLRMNYEVVIL